MITVLLDFARPSDLNRQTQVMGSLLSHSIKLIQQDATNKNIEIALLVDMDICPVWIDSDRLAQCLLNLYINAIQAMEDGGTLTVQCSADGVDYLQVIVKYSGPGISPDQIINIFYTYFTTKKQGTGLGLAIVYKIIEAHQGQIAVDSTIGEGTSFTIRIPCQSSETVKR